MIPATELAAMQAVAAASLDITGCQIQRATPADDGYGHTTKTWATIATVTAGMAKPSAQVMTQYAGRIGALASWVVSLPLGTDVKADDQLLIIGQTLRVQADLTQSSYSTLTQVLATEIRP